MNNVFDFFEAIIRGVFCELIVMSEVAEPKPRTFRISKLVRALNKSRKASKVLQRDTIVSKESVMQAFKINMCEIFNLDTDYQPNQVRTITKEGLAALVSAIQSFLFRDIESARDVAHALGHDKIGVKDVHASRVACKDAVYSPFITVDDAVKRQYNFAGTSQHRTGRKKIVIEE